MDIHPIEAEPTSAERAAVDHLLGPPESGWTGGVRRPELDGRVGIRRPRRPRPPARAPAGAVGGAGAHRVDQPGRAQLRLRAPDGAARRRVRRRDLLRDARHRSAAAARDPRLRGPGVPLLRLGRADRAARGAVRPRGRRCPTTAPPPGTAARASASATARPAALVTDAGRRAGRARAGADHGRDVLAVAGRPGRATGDPVTDAAADRRLDRALLARVGRDRPGQPRRLPRRRRLRGAAPGGRARPGGRDPRGEGLEADGPRRRRVPDRREVGGGRPPAGAAALPDLQRRRVGARHVQGPRRDRGRSVLADRVDDDRRLRDRLRASATSTCAASTRWRTAILGDALGRGAPARLPRRRRARARASRSTSRSARAPAPTSAARRPRSSTRSRASAASRATSPRSRSWPGCSRKPTVINNVETLVNVLDVLARRRPGLRGDRHRGAPPARSCSASPATSRVPGVYEVPFGATLRRAARARRRHRRAAGRCRRCCSAARPAASSGRTSSTCR